MRVLHQIKVDGTIVPINKKLTVDEMQALVATGTKFALIEPVHLPDQPKWQPGSPCMWVHESGLLHGLPRNDVASSKVGQNIVGDVFIAEHEESDFNDD